MSSDLYWSKIPVDETENNISSIKRSIARKIWDFDGSGGSGGYENVGKELIPFLEGIVVGNGSGDMARDAQKLINAIHENGMVRICINN